MERDSKRGRGREDEIGSEGRESRKIEEREGARGAKRERAGRDRERAGREKSESERGRRSK